MANLVTNGYMDGTANAGSINGWSTAGGSGGYLRTVSNQPFKFDWGFATFNSTSILKQTITFPTSGNYLLTYYWIRPSSNSAYDNTLLTTLGSIVSNPISIKATDPVNPLWVQILIPFSIKTASTQELKFSSGTTPSYNESFHISGVSIVSTDYMLDLYFEWIPDDYVEEQHANIKRPQQKITN
jgi:hypothetical protein